MTRRWACGFAPTAADALIKRTERKPGTISATPNVLAVIKATAMPPPTKAREHTKPMTVARRDITLALRAARAYGSRECVFIILPG